MIIEKKCLSEAIRVLGKCCGASKEVRFVGVDGDCWASVWDGEEMVSVRMECEVLAERVDFVVGVKELRELIRGYKGKSIEVVGEFKRVADMIIPDHAVMVELPDDFCSLVGAVASVVDRSESRAILRGIHLCSEGIVATDGKQLLHIPFPLNLPKPITLPFPLALLLARPEGAGSLAIWDDWFFITIGNLTWSGKCLQGQYPNWKQAIPSEKVLNYSISLSNSEEVLNFLKLVPDSQEVNGIELNVTPQGVSVVPLKYPGGHLAPAASMSISDTAMSESFYLSNMSPQDPSLNRGMWSALESQVHNLGDSDNSIHVVTGPIFSGETISIGENCVTVPNYYYKIVYSP